ncbi:MAG TPA: phenylalanine--tRNA ligase subunit beta, partial [Phycisphaerae bacterium]|nr:phenylalanine--tRNA ligase subunit beta [Phycisphaerae bacterium]
MNTSINWLKQYVDTDLSPEQLAELFTGIGLNCDGVEIQDSDAVLDLEVTSNRPDCLGHIGIARELAAATGKELRLPKVSLPAGKGNINEITSVTVEAPELCPRYTARVIKNVKIGPSPKWLTDYLTAVGIRCINNVVDITNYILMEYSQPLHSFDFDRLDGKRIIVRRARKGEKIVSIDETTCELTDEMLVIADAKKPVAIAGIMGGLNSEVTDSTRNILLESARFDPLCIRRTSRALNLMSDSNYRYERGVDPVMLDEASRRACQLICELAGGEMAEGVVDVWANPFREYTVKLRPQRTDKVLGIEIPSEKQAEILAGLGLGITKTSDGELLCTIPSFRPDLVREIDLIEEIARLWGYDKIPLRHSVTHQVRAMGSHEKIRRLVEDILAAAGYSEGIIFTFADDSETALFGYENPIHVDTRVRKSNNALRPTILPSLLRAFKSNQDVGNTSLSLFEIASVFPPSSSQPDKPAECTELAMATTYDMQDVLGALQAAVARVAPQAELTVTPQDFPGLESGECAAVLLDGEKIGMKVFLYFNEPLALPREHEFWKIHPELAGEPHVEPELN